MTTPSTPVFPAWKHIFKSLRQPLRAPTQRLEQTTLAEMERECSAGLPEDLFQRPDSGINSRERIYTLPRTFWCFLWQVLQRQASCREVVRQVQALFQMHGGATVDEGTSAYCQARQRLPLSLMETALAESAHRADRVAPATPSFLRGRTLKVVDGSTLVLADTPENQLHYPQMANQTPGCGFPLLKLVALFSLRSGAVLACHTGNKHMGERQGLQACQSALRPGDILVGDRQFGNYVVAAWIVGLKGDLIARIPTGRRRVDFRQGKRLGPLDRLVSWKKPLHLAPGFTPEAWAALPETLTVRIVRARITRRGFRPRDMTLVTTLLDPLAYPASELLEAYLRRWELELCLDDLKTTMGMATLRCRKPALVQKELRAFLIAHNLVRWIIAKAAKQEGAAPRRISFKGTIDALRHFQIAMARATCLKQRRNLWHELLRIIATDLIPLRPDRREPRAVKRRIKYPRLTHPRHLQRDRPQRHIRRSRSKQRLI